MNTKLLKMTPYYDEFLRYYSMAKTQQEECNLGNIRHEESSVDDELMKHVHLFDVVNRRYAGFSQIVHDCFYGWSADHPYWDKMQSGDITEQRRKISTNWTGKRNVFGLEEWLYLFLLHRLTGSGINYAKKPSGYHNTLLEHLHVCDTIPQMVEFIKTYNKSFYTSVGYQFPSFPKPKDGYKRGGDYFLCEYLPRLVQDLAQFLTNNPGQKKNLRDIGDFMFAWNKENGLRAYKFQYAAFIADIADWFPEFVNKESPFYYGTNAIECLEYLAKKIGRMKREVFLDTLMKKIYEDTGAFPYDAEDVACDFIRWIENYVKPGHDYNHIDYDKLWNSSTILDHPFGRQKAMLDLGLVTTFSGITEHPSDDKIIKASGLSELQYKEQVKQLYESTKS
jgi:hypothetical protein